MKKTSIILLFIFLSTPLTQFRLISFPPPRQSSSSVNPFAIPNHIHILIIRKVSRSKQKQIGCTPGELYINGVYFCQTLEQPFRNAENNISSIHPGIYRAKVRFSQSKKQWRIQLQAINTYGYGDDPFIPNREIKRLGIQLHSGSRPEHTQGCILLGQKGRNSCRLSRSNETFGRLLDTYFDSRHNPNQQKKITVVIRTDYK